MRDNKQMHLSSSSWRRYIRSGVFRLDDFCSIHFWVYLVQYYPNNCRFLGKCVKKVFGFRTSKMNFSVRGLLPKQETKHADSCPLTDLFVAVMVKNEIQRTVLSNIILPTNSASFWEESFSPRGMWLASVFSSSTVGAVVEAFFHCSTYSSRNWQSSGLMTSAASISECSLSSIFPIIADSDFGTSERNFSVRGLLPKQETKQTSLLRKAFQVLWRDQLSWMILFQVECDNEAAAS